MFHQESRTWESGSLSTRFVIKLYSGVGSVCNEAFITSIQYWYLGLMFPSVEEQTQREGSTSCIACLQSLTWFTIFSTRWLLIIMVHEASLFTQRTKISFFLYILRMFIELDFFQDPLTWTWKGQPCGYPERRCYGRKSI
jgi:hypothetical protein